jgi:hypothetical protein
MRFYAYSGKMADGGGKLPRLLALKLIGRNNGLRFMGRGAEMKGRRLMKCDPREASATQSVD